MEIGDNKNKRQMVAGILIAASVFFALMTLIKVRSFFVASAKAQSIVAGAVAHGNSEVNAVLEKNLAGMKKIAEGLKKKNLFVPTVKKQHPVSAVVGIMGSEALINGKWHKVGDAIGDAKVVAIEPTLVKIEWQGKEKAFAPISAITSAPPAPVAAKKEPMDKKPEKSARKAEARKIKPSKVEIKTMVASGGDDPLAWLGIELPPKLREKLLQQWNKASDEERREAMDKWNNMPPEEREEAMEQMQRMSG